MRPPLKVALADPELGKLLDGWGREGDVGVIAQAKDRQLVGAAWYRFWTDADHSYDYVDASTPELAVGVIADARGRGIGAALLNALIERARSENVARISLSVERDNPAHRLYQRMGFETVGSNGNAWTMTIAT